MMQEWLHDAPTSIGSPSAIFGYGDIAEDFDSIVNAFDNAADFLQKAVKTSKILSEFSKIATDLGVQTTAFIPQTRVIRVAGKVLLGGKILKLVLGEDEEGGGFKEIGAIDIDQIFGADVDVPNRVKMEILIRELRARVSGAGITILDPVWLADPKV